jgi:PKD repeat protein
MMLNSRKYVFSHAALLIFIMTFFCSASFAGAPEVFVVYPAKEVSVWTKAPDEMKSVKGLFRNEDVLASYEDGSALVISNEKTMGIIKQNNLRIDPSLTSPDRYSQILGNNLEAEGFVKSTSMLSQFEVAKPSGTGFFIVQFQGPVIREWLDNLETSGAIIIFPMPPYAYLVWGDGLEELLRTSSEIRTAFALNPVRKLSTVLLNYLGSLEREDATAFLKRQISLSVIIAETYENQAVTARDALLKIEGITEAMFGQSTQGNYFIWEVDTTVQNIPAIANNADVFYIERIDKATLCGERELVLDIGKFDATGEGPLAGISYERWLADKGVNGAGVTVQCVDTGLDRGNATNMPGTVHTDILGRVAGIVDYSGDNNGIDNHGHGTLNAGIIAGNPFTRLKDTGGFIVSMGVAPKSKIFETKVGNSTSFTFRETHSNMVQEARSYGASISLQPWGWGTRTFNITTGDFSPPPAYSATAAEFDRLTRVANGNNINPLPVLFVFAAGNSGWFCDMFGCQLVEQSINDPGLAKNVISVGAFTGSPPEGGHRRDPVQNTSRGTTGDGRIAPTLVAPGIGITGMASQSDSYQNSSPVFYPEGQTLYTRGNGSSHAAAQVAGAAALFTDWWQRFHNYSSTPSPALVKASLINSAEDEQGGTYPVYIPDGIVGMGEPRYDTVDFAPDMNQGWGGLNLDKLIPDKGKEINYIYFDQDTKTFDANGQSWETTIYAIDNDTPMFITLVWTDPAASPTAGKALVNDLDLTVTNGADQIIYGNNFSKGWSGAGGTADHTNNVEAVKIKNPYGAFKVKVKAVSLSGKLLPNDSGPKQDFALVVRGATLASPKGVVTFTAQYYRCNSSAGVILADLNLAGQATKQLRVTNQTNSQFVDVTLQETPPNSGVFIGTFGLTTTSEAGKLQAVDGDALFVQYNDADDGTGKPAVVTSQAHLDCTVPQVTNFVVSDHTAFSLVLNFALNKKASGVLKYGTSQTALNNIVPLEDVSMLHVLKIGGLNPCTVYYAQLELVDDVGNTNTDNNNDAFYSFQTLADQPIFFDDLDLSYVQSDFTHASIQGTDDWSRIDDTNNAYSPTHAMRTMAITSVKDIYLKTKNVKLQPFSRLTFYHKFSLEPGFDGAVVEISTDNGAHWRDLGNQIVEGKYSAMIALFSGNPLMARLAWTYVWTTDKDKFHRSWIDLDKFRNASSVQIRFRLATDDSIILPNSAWYIDDVKISYDSECQQTLFMRMDRSNYGPNENVTITVFDPTLPSAVSVNVTVSCETEPAGETVSLAHAAVNKYSGFIVTKNLGAAHNDGKISCADGDIITAIYSSSANGGTSNPNQVQAKAFYRLPSLIFSPPLNEGVNKINNKQDNALVFPMEMTSVGADIIITSMKFGLTADSKIEPSHIAPSGMSLYEDTNDDRTFSPDVDTLIGTATLGVDGTVTFSGLNYTVSRDNAPRFFLLADLTDKVPFGTMFQFEIPSLATDLVAKLQDSTPIVAKSDRPPQGLKLKVVSRAILVNQNAPTIFIEDGETWETAFHTIGDAIITARNRATRSKGPVEVWVARGRYMEGLINPYGKAIYSNIYLYGGFGGTESNKDAPRRYIMQTMIERPHCDETPRSVYDTHNWYYPTVIDLYGGGLIDGFHITAAYNYNVHWNQLQERTIGINCIGNNGQPVKIRNCILRNVTDWAITSNVDNACPNSVVSNCTFAWLKRAPVQRIGLGTMFINCSFYNVQWWDIRNFQYYFYNCAWDDSVHYGSYWSNDAHIGGGTDEYNRVRNCLLPYGTSWSEIFGDERGNKKESPRFINPDMLDFRLQPGSPGIDAGRSSDNTQPELANEFPPLDIRGDDRIIGSAPDIGAYEITPGKAIYYVKSFSFGNEGDPQPVIFRPDQPVPIRLTLGSYNQPADMVTLGGRMFFTDHHFKVDFSLGLFAPTDVGTLEQIKNLPFSITLTGNPTVFYEMNVFVDFLKTDGSNEVLDNAFFNFMMPAFVDPVNGSDENKTGLPGGNTEPVNSGGIRQPFKTLAMAMYFLQGRRFNEDMKIYVAEGTVKDYLWSDANSEWYSWPTVGVEILGGFNAGTWERNPGAFETVWTGENQRSFIYDDRAFAYKLDGFTFKEGIEQAIDLHHSDYYYYYGPNYITNNIFMNNNGNSIMRLEAYLGQRWYSDNNGLLTACPIWSSIGAPLTNATGDGSVLFSHRSTSGLPISNINNVTFSEFTIECWFYPRNFGRSAYWYNRTADLIKIYKGNYDSSYDFLYLLVDENKHARAHFMQTGWGWYDGQRVTDSKELEVGKWHHLAFTMQKDPQNPNNHYAYLYVDGTLAAIHTSGQTTPFNLTPDSAMIGSPDGCIDEVRIWNRALSADEILANRDKEILTGNGLVCAFHFNEQKGIRSISSVGDLQVGDINAYMGKEVNEADPVFDVSNNVFTDNKAVGINLYYGVTPILIHNNIFKNNQNRFLDTTGDYGRCSPFIQVSNNVLLNNVTPNNISLINLAGSAFNNWFLNNTIVGNNAKVFTAGTYDDGNGDLYSVSCAVNNIIKNNTGVIDEKFAWLDAIPGRYVYNLIDDKDATDAVVNPAWAQNYTCADPKFDADSWHLTDGSCAIGKGPAITQTNLTPPLTAMSNPVKYFSDSDSAVFSTEGGTASNSQWNIYWGGWAHVLSAGPITATWILSGVEPTEYEVYAYIPNYGWNDSDVSYVVTHKNGKATVNINQYQNRGTWVSLGTYELDGTANMKVQLTVATQGNISLIADDVRTVYRPVVPPVGNTDPPSAFIMHNFWNMDKDIDGQGRPAGQVWDTGADQFVGDGGAVVQVRLLADSSRLAGIPFSVELKLTRNYDRAPAGFNFRIQYPAGTVTALTAEKGSLNATPTVGGEQPAGGGKVYRSVSAIPGNTGNTERNPQLVKLNITVVDPYPESLTIEILPPAAGQALQDAGGVGIPSSIDDSMLENLTILAPNPTANFSAVPTRGLINPDAGLYLSVYFQDASLGYVTSWEWDFGDSLTSIEKNPMHEYINPGIYTVKLTVQGPYGKSVKIRQDYIVASDPRNPPVANFTAEPFNVQTQRVEGPAPLRVEFLDATNGPTSTFSWTFGDDQTSNAQNPTHVYQNQGDYTVTFAVDGPMGGDTITKTNFVHVTAPQAPVAKFNVDKPFGFAPHSVAFTDISTGSNIQFYYYDFGDGKWSQKENPKHQYILPGNYNSRLTIAGATGFDVSNPTLIEVKQAFPQKLLVEILLGRQTPTTQDRQTLDFNKDGILDVSDIITYIQSQK